MQLFKTPSEDFHCEKSGLINGRFVIEAKLNKSSIMRQRSIVNNNEIIRNTFKEKKNKYINTIMITTYVVENVFHPMNVTNHLYVE